MQFKLQHYVPRFYLKYFGYHLFCFDKLKGKSFKCNAEDICAEKLFYDFPQANVTLEKWLSKLESDFNQACLELIDKQDIERINIESKEKLALFIASQLIRSKEKRKQIKELGDIFINDIIKEFGFSGVRGYLKEEAAKALQVELLIQKVPYIAGIILKMRWTLGVNTTETPFWCSDNPVALHNEFDLRPYGNLGLTSRGIEIHFPINSELILIIHDPKSKLHNLLPVVDIITDFSIQRKGRVTFENSLQVWSSNRFVFSRDNNFYLVKRMIKDDSIFKNKDGKRIRSTRLKPNLIEMI